ncbi:purple acid phosphatase [Bacteroidia bacterium]|nr:purple acid phosphatase [Bacteroidia bacterium]
MSIALCLTILCVKRWDVWFGNPIEPPYQTLTEPSRIQLTFGAVGERSRNVSWQCGDTLAPSNLLLIKEGDVNLIPAEGKIFHTTGGTTVSYHAVLDSLSAGEYHYRVETGGKQSAWYDFKVNADAENFSFVYLGDVQDTVGGVSKQFFKNIRHWQPDAAFWLFGGDVIERPHDQYWNEYFTSMDTIAQTLPILAIAGNHEYLKGVTRTLEERFIYTFSYFLENTDFAAYELHYGNTAIILLDSNRDFWELPAQRKWLEAALAKPAQWKIVALHHPVYSIRGKMNNLTVRWAFNDLFQKYGVDLVLQGHEHGYARMINEKTTPVYIISNSSPKDYRLYFNEKYQRFGNGERFYNTISASGDSLVVKTFTEENELYDDILLLKNKEVRDRATDIIPEHFEINNRSKKFKGKELNKYQHEIRAREGFDK